MNSFHYTRAGYLSLADLTILPTNYTFVMKYGDLTDRLQDRAEDIDKWSEQLLKPSEEI